MVRNLIVVGFGILANARRSDLYASRDFFALHLDGQTSPADLALNLSIQYAGPIGELSGHHVFSAPKKKLTMDGLLSHQDIRWGTKLSTATNLQRRRRPASSEARLLGQPCPDAVAARERVASTLGISDPTFGHQWHLFNTVQPGNDLNVTGVWLEGVTGEGVTTAVIDDGLDMDGLELQPNYYAGGSYDFNDDVPEPRPRLPDDHHGTLCAAEIAGAKNDICGIGVAYRSRVSGIRMLSGAVDDAEQAAALNYDFQHNDIYSCSWGPADDGRTMAGPGALVRRAVVNGVQNGRGGRGSVFVFSAGNGAGRDDDCNFDGYANSIYGITVGAVDRTGTRARYSEPCAAQLAVRGARVKPQAWLHSPWQQVDGDIPEGHEGLASYYTTTPDMLRRANLARLEHVTVTVNVDHGRRGDLSVDLVSPGGMVSHLSTPRMPDGQRAGYVDWEFMSVAHWGESGVGTWRLLVKDTNVNGLRGVFVNWRLNLWGEAIDGSHQPRHPLPGEPQEYGTQAATMTAAPLSFETDASGAETFRAETFRASLATKMPGYMGMLAFAVSCSVAGLLIWNYSRRPCIRGHGRGRPSS
ncbi:Peptidase S8, subtilisin-related protein [Ophiocordyceps sinensis CO18]|uniref:Peptidase S8, subtilisin-related protein n=1 Tax=Ophiocordyceps sinensis (strain Co18 / CGMCC 3.14243) TaxID=911162 RepID=T5AHG3_OPHSC|nr:Peptidase S8, subtilisin-related protein [Ophiocordyceps sinensis CO18]